MSGAISQYGCLHPITKPKLLSTQGKKRHMSFCMTQVSYVIILCIWDPLVVSFILFVGAMGDFKHLFILIVYDEKSQLRWFKQIDFDALKMIFTSKWQTYNIVF